MNFLGIGNHDSLFEKLDACFVLAHCFVIALLALDATLGFCAILPFSAGFEQKVCFYQIWGRDRACYVSDNNT